MNYLIFLFLLILIASNAFCGSYVIEHKRYWEDISAYCHVSPIINNDGQYQGIVASDTVESKIDIYDSLGYLSQSINPDKPPIKTINRLNSEGDSLFIYALLKVDSSEPYGIQLYTLSYDAVQLDSIILPPSYKYLVGLMSRSSWVISVDLTFVYNHTNNPISVEYYIRQGFRNCDFTMGCTTNKIPTLINYNLELTEQISRKQKDCYRSVCIDLGKVSLHSKNIYNSVVDDPNNSYTYYGTTVGVDLDDTLVLKQTTDYGSSGCIFTGDFLPNMQFDEFIYYGRAKDLLNNHDGINYHFACYNFENDSFVEKWYTIVNPFNPYIYNSFDNVLIGIRQNTRVMLFDCSNGLWVDSVQLDYNLSHKYFYLDSEFSRPHLFGLYDDTLFIYGFSTSTDVPETDDQNLLPVRFTLSQNYPNPFNPTTTIEYTLQIRSDVTITVFDILGRRVKTLFDQNVPVGTHSTCWDGTDIKNNPVATGVYFYQIKAGDFVETKKMLLLK